jgi:hypothetical protein
MDDKQLRRRLIRLAYEKPELRDEILPLVASRPKEAAPDPFKMLAAKAEDLAKACDEIAKAARAGKYGKIDNMALRADTYEARCRLMIKALKAARGKQPS